MTNNLAAANTIRQWPKDERPRERLLQHGATVLSDAELLAIFLRVGVSGKSAVDLARELLHHFEGCLSRLVEASLDELTSVRGVGISKAAQLKATFELSRRALEQNIKQGDTLGSPEKVCDWLKLRLATQKQETFLALWLNTQNRLIESEELARGSLRESHVYPREIVKSALENNAAAVIFAHNHPSGSTQASDADRELTRELQSALSLIDVKLLDHFIVAANSKPLSFAQCGWL